MITSLIALGVLTLPATGQLLLVGDEPALPVRPGQPARPATEPAAAPADVDGKRDGSVDAALLQQLSDLEQRIANIESILGPDMQLGSTLESLKAQIAEANGGMKVRWKDGLRFESDDVNIKIGGRIQVDNTFASGDSNAEDSVGNLDDGSEFRRSRIYMSGDVYDKQLQWKAQYDFAGGDADFKDVYMQFNQLPVIDNVRVGQFKEPFSLEENTSSNYVTFLERALPNALVPGRSTGIGTTQTWADKRVALQVGVFRDGTDSFGDASGDGSGAVTARLSGLALYQPDNQRLLHLGAAISSRSIEGDMLRFRSRPEAHQLQRFVDTGDFEADDMLLMGVEAAYVDGPFSVQGEFVRADVESDTMDDPQLDGGYVYASYFLTGESRPYKKGAGAFNRVVPEDPVITKDGKKGKGAWEVAARWSTLDLEDADLTGGELTDYTVGLNWYLSRNTRMMFNWVRADMDESVNGDADIFLMRWQTDF